MDTAATRYASCTQESLDLGGRRFTLRKSIPVDAAGPLIIAIHGGGFSSAYFDVERFSLLARASSLGIPVIAIDRAGYGGSEVKDPSDLSHSGQASLLTAAIRQIWKDHGSATRGIVLIGHSIGGAIALMIAANRPDWPLLGVAISGVGLTNYPGDAEAWNGLPPIPFIEMPSALKDPKMFGRPGTFDADAPELSHRADAPAARAELIDIVTSWPRDGRTILGRITVPVHYRQGDGDALWIVSRDEVTDFAAAASSAAFIDAALVPHAGHCLDFHKIGAAFQLEQLAFAMKCAAYADMAV